jgi:Holliday junction DNA helicase RuvA
VVREQELTLYGFADADEREVFEALQTAAGVGPRLAQAVLAVHPPDEVRRAVATEDLAALTLVPGIGRKGAQRIVLDLKDRLGPPVGAAVAASPSKRAPGRDEQVHGALVGLGYSAREADEALALVAAAKDDETATADGEEVSVVLRHALAVLRK